MVQPSLWTTWAELDWSRHFQSHRVSLGNPILSFTCLWRHVDAADKFVTIIGFVSEFWAELSFTHLRHCVLMFLQFGRHGSEEGLSRSDWSVCCHVIGWMSLKMHSLLVFHTCFSKLKMIFLHEPNCSHFLVMVFFLDRQNHAARFLYLFVSLEWKLFELSGRSLFTV